MTIPPREPTVLDRLNNLVTTDRDVKKMVMVYAKSLLGQAFTDGFTEKITRDDMRKALKQWLHGHSFTGRSTKTLVDKTVSKVLKGYESNLRLRLMAQAAKFANDDSFDGESKAKRIRSDLARGQVGKRRDRWLYRW